MRSVESGAARNSPAFLILVQTKFDQISARQPRVCKQLCTSCSRADIAAASDDRSASAIACRKTRSSPPACSSVVVAHGTYLVATYATVLPCCTRAVFAVAFHTYTELLHAKCAYARSSKLGCLYPGTEWPGLHPAISVIPLGCCACAKTGKKAKAPARRTRAMGLDVFIRWNRASL